MELWNWWICHPKVDYNPLSCPAVQVQLDGRNSAQAVLQRGVLVIRQEIIGVGPSEKHVPLDPLFDHH